MSGQKAFEKFKKELPILCHIKGCVNEESTVQIFEFNCGCYEKIIFLAGYHTARGEMKEKNEIVSGIISKKKKVTYNEKLVKETLRAHRDFITSADSDDADITMNSLHKLRQKEKELRNHSMDAFVEYRTKVLK